MGSIIHKPKYVGILPNPSFSGKRVKIVFSDLVTEEFRKRKPDPEFPMSLDAVESVLNSNGYADTDYAFLPSVGVWKEMRKSLDPLLTLGVRGQKRYPVMNARIWGINIMNYLQTPAFFSLLTLAGVPVFREKRRKHDPVIVLGGHVWPNPLPLSSFYDVMVVGDGEDVMSDMAGLARETKDRETLLEAISGLSGVYVPDCATAPVKRARIDFKDGKYPAGSSYLLNGVGAVLLSRGCPHFCSFCNSSHIGGPYRVKPYHQLIAHVDRLSRFGAKKIMLVAATTSCYRSEGKTAHDFMTHIGEKGITVRTMSDRPEDVTPAYLRASAKEKRKMLLAPEASPDIRTRLFRKTIREETIFNAVSSAIDAGISHIQLYIILAIPRIGPGIVDFLPNGFPGERPGDIAYVAQLAMAIADRMNAAFPNKPGNNPHVSLDCMPIVPAIGTELEKVAFPKYEAYKDSIRCLTSRIQNRGYGDRVSVTTGMDRKTHLLQAFLERNDASAGELLWHVFQKSESFDIDFQMLEKTIHETGYDTDELFEAYSDKKLPYEGLIEEEDNAKTVR